MVLSYIIFYLHIISDWNLTNLSVYQLLGIILRLTRFPWIMMMNFGLIKCLFPCRIKSISIVQSTVISTYVLRYMFISLICICASLLNIWCSPTRKTSSEFSDIFRQENPKFSRCFPVDELKYSFHYPAVFLFNSWIARMRKSEL